MPDWRRIDGYFWPYRINEDAVVERQLDNGSWRRLNPYIVRDKGKTYGRLVIKMKRSDGRYLQQSIKNLMADAFLGGRRPGTVIGMRTPFIMDCSLSNLYITTQSDIGKRNGGPNHRSVEKVDRDGNVVALYSSVREAAKKNYMSRRAVARRCNCTIKGDPFLLDGFNYRYEDRGRGRKKKNAL